MGGAYDNVNNVNNVHKKIETMLKKQIELTNAFMNMMSILMTKLCNFINISLCRIRGYDLIVANQPNNRAHADIAVVIKSNMSYEVLDLLLSYTCKPQEYK